MTHFQAAPLMGILDAWKHSEGIKVTIRRKLPWIDNSVTKSFVKILNSSHSKSGGPG